MRLVKYGNCEAMASMSLDMFSAWLEMTLSNGI